MVIGNATVTRLRDNPGGIDENGDPIASVSVETVISGAAIAPRTAADITDRGRQGRISSALLLVPFGTDVRHTDRFRVEGLVSLDGEWDVDGDAGQWKSPFTGWEAGCEVALKRAAG